jgi:hypothetical protein
MMHPTCFMHDVCGISTMIGVPGSQLLQLEVVPHLSYRCGWAATRGLLIQEAFHLCFGCLPSGSDLRSRQHQWGHLNFVWQQLPSVTVTVETCKFGEDLCGSLPKVSVWMPHVTGLGIWSWKTALTPASEGRGTDVWVPWLCQCLSFPHNPYSSLVWLLDWILVFK